MQISASRPRRSRYGFSVGLGAVRPWVDQPCVQVRRLVLKEGKSPKAGLLLASVPADGAKAVVRQGGRRSAEPGDGESERGRYILRVCPLSSAAPERAARRSPDGRSGSSTSCAGPSRRASRRAALRCGMRAHARPHAVWILRGRLRPSPWTPSSHTPGSGSHHVLPCAASWPYGPRPRARGRGHPVPPKLPARTGRASGTPLVRFSGPEMLRPQLLHVPLRRAEFLGHRRGRPALLRLPGGVAGGIVRQFCLHLFAIFTRIEAALRSVISPAGAA